MAQMMKLYPPQVAQALRTPVNLRSASEVGISTPCAAVSTPCGAVSTRGIVDVAPVMVEL